MSSNGQTDKKPAPSEAGAAQVELVNITIDGKAFRVPKGTNLIDAAKQLGIEIPHYCYHPHLSIAGNCRMCQVRVKGAPKMDIACNTMVREGMEVLTHETSKEVSDAQAATLEFILINHPLDCTVCDQAGHCKLQDYHFEYNARPSRFLENKVHKVKAVPLGPTVMLDGERCIMCTRCVRFCDEVTGTSELGMLNRGDRSVIAVNPNRELNNALSGTVVDLCPVGALTHRNWRFNTRIWFTKETDSVCPGCSTGCNVKVAVRDKQVVQVKARLNSEVNKEWLCDQGRYGFMRFYPERRFVAPQAGGAAAGQNGASSKVIDWVQAIKELKAALSAEGALVLLSPQLLLEEYELLRRLLAAKFPKAKAVMAFRTRELNQVERLLVSPDFAANFAGAQFSGIISAALSPQELEAAYIKALQGLRSAEFNSVVLAGHWAVDHRDDNQELAAAVGKCAHSAAIAIDCSSPAASACRVIMPGRSILEKSGLLINSSGRLQYNDRVIEFPAGSEPEWRIFNRLAAECGAQVCKAESDREVSLWYLGAEKRLSGLKIAAIKQGGICLNARLASGAVQENLQEPGAIA